MRTVSWSRRSATRTADGLRTAHAHSIVHRDIKPSNIIVAETGPNRSQPKLLDFGIAKVGHGGDTKLTQEGVVLGSPEYMSPEQALGLEQIDARTDVWSLGIALYEMVSGQVPFARANYNALMHAIINDEPKPLTAVVRVDSKLSDIVKKALRKSPDERWANMGELGAALAEWLHAQDVKEDAAGNSLRAVWLGTNDAARASSMPPKGEALADRITLTDALNDASRRLGPRGRVGLAAAGLLVLAVVAVVLLTDDPGSETQMVAEPSLVPPVAQGVSDELPTRVARPEGSALTPQDLPLASETPKEGKPPRPAVRTGGAAKSPSKKQQKARRDFGF
jgi:serine/threonine-protein kinase